MQRVSIKAIFSLADDQDYKKLSIKVHSSLFILNLQSSKRVKMNSGDISSNRNLLLGRQNTGLSD